MTQPAVIRLPAFWAAALGYVVEDNHELIERLLSAGAIPQDTVVTIDDRPAFRTLQAVRHPDDPVQEGTVADRINSQALRNVLAAGL
jgi:hypothetical protein